MRKELTGKSKGGSCIPPHVMYFLGFSGPPVMVFTATALPQFFSRQKMGEIIVFLDRVTMKRK
jgi:hypothetical protein